MMNFNKLINLPMSRIFTIAISLVFLVSSVFTSCKNRAESDDQQEIDIVQSGEINEEIKKAVYPLPTSAEVIKMLTELEVGYIIGISNPPENASNYVTSKSQAINLGIYGADLSYATLYNMNQDVINYLDAIRELATDLKMSRIYSKTLYEEIKDSFDNKDRLVSLLTEAFDETYAYLSDNDQQSLALLVVAGGWVEGMYITTHISESVYHVTGIVEVLLEQKKSFELFLDIARPHDEDPVVNEILTILTPVIDVYDTIDDESLSLKDVENLTKAIEIVRAQLIS